MSLDMTILMRVAHCLQYLLSPNIFFLKRDGRQREDKEKKKRKNANFKHNRRNNIIYDFSLILKNLRSRLEF